MSGGLQKPIVKNRSAERVKAMAMAAGLFGTGMLLHRLPQRMPLDGWKTILPADWKVWARVFLGLGAVQKTNQALDWHLPPWLSALETIAVVNPLAAGFSVNNLKQTAIMAPLVMAVVQGAHVVSQKAEKPARENFGIPTLATQLGLTSLTGLGAMLIYPPIYKAIAKSGVLGKDLKQKAAESASAFATATFASCARGCSPGSFICLSELADVGGSLGLWLKDKLTGQKTNQKPAWKSKTT